MKAPLPLFEPITREQNRLIHALARGSALSDRQLYSMVEELIGIPSLTALSRQEASCLIHRIVGDQTSCLLNPRRENQMPGAASRFPNYRHIVAIRLIARRLGWNREHLKNWLKKYVKVSSIAEMDRQSARRAFLGLMQVQKRRGKKVLEQ
jgi:hypothetical protein